MNRRSDLPPGLNARGFRVGDALASGSWHGRLACSDLDAPAHGARVPAGGRRLDAIAALLGPGQAFTGPTSAKIWGIPLPRFLEEDERIWVSTLSHDRHMRRPGVVASRRLHGAHKVVGGYPVLGAARTWCSLQPLLEVHDLVAAGDRIITGNPWRPALATHEDLRISVARMRRGKLAMAQALSEVRHGSWSRTESLLRIACTRAGLPEPRLNAEVSVGGGRRAAPDLAWPEWRTCAEYDGHWHDDPRRRAADLERHELLADAGWLVTRIRARDLFPDPIVAVSRVLRRLSERGYVHPRPFIERAETTGWRP